MRYPNWISLLGTVAIALAASACSSSDASTDEPTPPEGTELTGEDIPVGDLGEEDLKADGNWGAATTCKAIPSYPKLTSPKIYVSLEGLTLRLSDPATGYNKVFPIGPGAIDTQQGSLTYNESKSMYPVLSQATGDFEIRPSTVTPCKIWWTDSSTGEKLPVFAGLPFLSWSGSYGIHGPVDNYRAADGGTLRRGFVSHGCIRMRGADVLEVYVRTKGIAKVPVHVQREPERDANGRRIDVADVWFGAECLVDADCTYQGGYCKKNAYSERGFCSSHCTAYCPDKTGEPVSFCVPDPDLAGKGMCVVKETPQNPGCKNLDHMVPVTATRFGQSGVSAKVCLPGTLGWVGDHCFKDSECTLGTVCKDASATVPGICTQPCTSSCPDQAGWSTTFCTNEPSLGGNACVRQCTPDTNASECPVGSTCQLRKRPNSTVSKNVCIPE
ncbi:MAG: L,D-transpeptidase [Deltaproteobacteria bacterium]|nr:L,D-transpeptidase [Deltaproteobacteria bacterium]